MLTDQRAELIRPVVDKKVKDVAFQIDSKKSPGPYGFDNRFYKAAWHIVGQDITEAIAEFFQNGKLLKQLNSTVIALIPKVENP